MGVGLDQGSGPALDRPLGKVPPGFLKNFCPSSTCSSFDSTTTTASLASRPKPSASPRPDARPRMTAIPECRTAQVHSLVHTQGPSPLRPPGRPLLADGPPPRFPRLLPCNHGAGGGAAPFLAAAGKPSAVTPLRPRDVVRARSAPAGASLTSWAPGGHRPSQGSLGRADQTRTFGRA
ncbi:unnamed protein product [Symbiodinium sp. CCMP2592]|nr:unnamed protein product [Symbiodinium sp. CCMP2592]